MAHLREVEAIQFATGATIACGQVLIAAGVWSPAVLGGLGSKLPVFPVMGEILALETIAGPRHVLLAGRRYLVPRDGGLVLAG